MGEDKKKIPRIGPPSVAQQRRLEYRPEEDEHDEHPDERWLVSYADMMTLLFGLFVLLFSMSTLDPQTAAKIKEQAEASFDKTDEPEEPKPVDRTPELEKRIQDLEAELKLKTEEMTEQQAKLTDQQNKLTEQQSKASEKDRQVEKLKNELAKVPKPEKTPEPKPSREPELEAQLAKREEEIENLKNTREDLKRQLASASQPDTAADQARAENEKLKQDLEKMKEELKKQVESLNGGRGQNFMAFFINWATKDHDVDLVIQDPKGKTFDFKHREFPGHPGLFALDTRRGPGVELWQSKDILPGKYKATYSLYNDYGNSESAPVNAVILTPKGSFELPLSKLDTKGHRRATAEFEVDTTGGVRILKSGN